MLKLPITISFIVVFLLSQCFSKTTKKINLKHINMAQNFEISVYASGIPDARSMALGPDGTVFVGNRRGNKIWAILDTNKDFIADGKTVFAKGLTSPNGVAIKGNDLFVAEISRILRFKDAEKNIFKKPKPLVIRDDLPKDQSHGWKYIGFGPDGYLYIPIGAPCNVCLKSDQRYASITRMKPDGSDFSVFAHGIRNSVGFDWHPDSKEFWFTDNGRDNMGDDIPFDELNHAPKAGLHFGFPFCHSGDIEDPTFKNTHRCDHYEPPAQKLGPHVAALGMKFYTGSMFPKAYHHCVFIAEHGSWNRTKKIGYRISLVRFKENKPVSYEVFAQGWMKKESVWGRPVDILELPDGSLLVSDDFAGVIYRITYNQH